MYLFVGPVCRTKFHRRQPQNDPIIQNLAHLFNSLCTQLKNIQSTVIDSTSSHFVFSPPSPSLSQHQKNVINFKKQQQIQEQNEQQNKRTRKRNLQTLLQNTNTTSSSSTTASSSTSSYIPIPTFPTLSDTIKNKKSSEKPSEKDEYMFISDSLNHEETDITIHNRSISPCTTSPHTLGTTSAHKRLNSPAPITLPSDACHICCGLLDNECDAVLFCDGCNVSVHPECYGVQKIPEGSWYCYRCSSKTNKKNVTCILCSNTADEAYTPTVDGKWVHTACKCYQLFLYHLVISYFFVCGFMLLTPFAVY